MKLRTIEVSYTQICVFDSGMETPFNDWTDAHVAQGFAWRPGSVSFGTLMSSGSVDIEVIVLDRPFSEFSEALRVISVPFEVPASGGIEIASIGDSEAISLEPGNYELIFEHFLNADGDMGARFSFRPTREVIQARIIRADKELSPPSELVMTALPA